MHMLCQVLVRCERDLASIGVCATYDEGGKVTPDFRKLRLALREGFDKVRASIILSF